MRRWTYLLGGLLCWAVHFSGLYAIASLDAQTAGRAAVEWRLAAAAFSAACASACLALGVAALRRRRREAHIALIDQLSLLGAGIALVAIAWQSLPTLIG